MIHVNITAADPPFDEVDMTVRDYASPAPAFDNEAGTHPTIAGEIVTAPSVGSWEPIATAPHDGKPILVFGGQYDKPTIQAADGEWWELYCPKAVAPTHWMPLPNDPTTERRLVSQAQASNTDKGEAKPASVTTPSLNQEAPT